MPDTNNELKRLLTLAQQALRQEKELFGDVIYTGPPEETAGSHEYSPPPRKKPAVVAEEVDLFGHASTPAHHTQLSPAQSRLLPYPDEPWVAAENLDQLNSEICTCLKCPLGRTRTKFVFGVGNPKADIVLVGEAPGADEDAQGEPFVGRAGQLLNKILEAIHFKREEVYICNILKCRPPNNREPQPKEVDSCEPHLWKQLEIIKPKIILCLGRIAGQTLLRTTESLTALRGKIHNYRGIKLMVTYHPAALLRNPNWKKPTWEDVQYLRKIYDEMKAKKE
ncbi:MAG TPA: uracil-DNA glycosylase [Bacteroidetes bacterium]|nr:uracil-DNA glycosylase [Bacteroidota bacterium]